MSSEELEKIIREYIDESIHMSFATCADNHPWVSEVHFVYDNNFNLYFRSKANRRHSEELAKNPNVAGNIVCQHAPEDYPHAVYFEGTAAMVTDEAQKAGAHAGNLIKAIAGCVGGGGGGRPNMAQAGGKNPAGIPEAVAKVKEILESQIS